jgi:chromosome partitioning protein
VESERQPSQDVSWSPGRRPVFVSLELTSTRSRASANGRLVGKSETFVSVPVNSFDLSEWRERLAEFSGHDLIVIDTPPGVEANLPAIRGLCEAATIVLVPTGTTRDDLDSVLPWMKELLEAKVRASFVLNKVNRRTNSFAKSRTRLIRVGPVCPIDIPALEEIHSQSDNGLTVLDLVKSKGHEPMEGLWMFTQQEAASA